MAGLFTGIIGSLIGAGIQATFGGIPVGEDASKALDVLRSGGLPVPPANWFSKQSSGDQKPQQVHDKIGQHITGAMQMLGPCTQMAKVVGDVAYLKSQFTPAEATVSQEEFTRSRTSYKLAGGNDPVSLLTGKMTNVEEKCKSQRSCSCGVTSSSKAAENPIIKNFKSRYFCPESIKQPRITKTNKILEKPGNSLPSNYFCKAQRMENPRPSIENRGNILYEDTILRMEKGKKTPSDPRAQDIKTDKFTRIAESSKGPKRNLTVKKEFPISKTEIKLVKPQKKSGKAGRGDKCHICQGQVRKIKQLPLISCGHMVCYKCLVNKKLSECPKCRTKFN